MVEASQSPPERIAVRYRLETFDEPVEILTREPYTLDGEPISVTIPHLGRFVGTEVVERPCGPTPCPRRWRSTWALHGLVVRRLDRDATAEVEVARVESLGSAGSRKIRG